LVKRKQPDAADEFTDEARVLAHISLVGRIEARMQLLGLNPYSASKKAGLGGDYVRDIIRGRVRNPSIERLGRLAEALDCSLYYLLGQPEPELRRISRTPVGDVELPAPPAPLPLWRPEHGKPGMNLLPIRYELMDDAFRPATDVVRPPIGFEPSSIPYSASNREVWWELVRDDTMDRVAPAGSLVLVAKMDDTERHLVEDGDYVVVSRHLVAPDAAFNLIERSMKRVGYRYAHLGLWFLEYDTEDHPDSDLTDYVWRETEPTAPARSLDELANEIEDPDERAAALAQNQMLREAIERSKDPANRERMKERVDRLNGLLADKDRLKSMLETENKKRHRLEGKVLRVLRPVATKSGFSTPNYG
jgi:transcriptional regulator with XRE-family HTH domain